MDVLSAAIGATQDADAAAAVAAIVAAGAAVQRASSHSNNTDNSRTGNGTSSRESSGTSRESNGATRESSGTNRVSSISIGGEDPENMDDDEDEAVPPSSEGTGGQSVSSSGVASGAVGSLPHAARSLAPPFPTVDPAAAEAHAKLEMQRQDIDNGRHPTMEEEKERQSDLKRRRVEIAADQKRLMLVNVDELRLAEIRDSQLQTNVALEKTQEELLDDVHQRIRKAKVDGGLVPATPTATPARRIGCTAGGEKEDQNEDDQAARGMSHAGKKRPRLMPARSYEKVTPEAVLAKAESRRIRTVTLSDIEMRRDFQVIIADWRERAKKYLSTYNNSHWTKVSVGPDSFRVRGVTFTKGDPVVVTSRVTGEEFHGEITVVKPRAVFLSLYGGVKTRIFVDHLSTGRLTVARADASRTSNDK